MSMRKSEKVNSPSEKKINKGKPIALLSILCVVMAFVIVMTFLRFPIGVKNYNSVLGAIDLDYDIAGGTAYTLTLASDNLEEVEDIEEVLKTLRYRMTELGYKAYSVKALNSTEEGVEDYEIRIEAKATETLASDIAVVAAYGEVSIVGGTAQSGNPEILTENKAIADAWYGGSYVGADNETMYIVNISFTDYGYNEIISLIDQAANSEDSSSSTFYMGIKVGETELMQEGTLTKDSFQGKTLMLTSTSEASAKQMALQVRTGGLAYKYDVSEGVSVSSPYGENVALKCVIVILALLLLAFVAFGVLYKGFGAIMSLSLLAFILLETLMLIAVPGITLSLGGVVGIGASMILTVLGLVLTANSVKAEFTHTEKTVRAAVKKGFKDMIMPIVNLFVVSGIVAALMLIFTTGVVNGFAITFGIGVIIGAITSLVFTRMFAALLLPISGYSEKFLGVKKVEA